MSTPKPTNQAAAINDITPTHTSESLSMNNPINIHPADASNNLDANHDTNQDAKPILPEQADDDLMAKLRIPQTYADAMVGVKKPLLTVAS